jgi:predicted XRE-type DNA-binding protein
MAQQEYIDGRGNVLADPGHPDADEMLAKTDLAIRIRDILHRRHLTQMKAAEILGVDQPKISALTRGRLAGFSIERLLRFLLLLGLDVSITIQPHRRSPVRQHNRKAKRGSRVPGMGTLTVREIGAPEIGAPKSAKSLRARERNARS